MANKSSVLYLVICVLSVFLVLPTQASDTPVGVFDFEAGLGFGPGQWTGGPVSTIGVDSVVVHGGKRSARIERHADSEGDFTAIRYNVPADRSGTIVELRGWLKSDGSDDWFGMWFRQDGGSGSVGFDNMQSRGLKGTTDWTEYRITLPLSPDARTFVVGALIAGKGTLWADDFSLWIDGKPLVEAPVITPELSVLDTDTEFALGSEINISSLSQIQTKNLYLLGRIWGFLKYHHPHVTAGQYQWDFELFRIMPAILAADDQIEAQEIFTNWVDSLGPIEPCDPCAKEISDPAQASNTDWLHDTDLLGDDLSTSLIAVHKARPASGFQFYVDLYPQVGNPNFKREIQYNKLAKIDAGFRLLALYRFWNIIEYWCPNRDIIGENWPDVLREFVPQLALSQNNNTYKLTMFKLIARLNDTHTQLRGASDVRPPSMAAAVPVSIRWIENQPVVTGWVGGQAESETTLLPGDIIYSVDGRLSHDLMDHWAPYYSASNEPVRRKNLVSALAQGELGPCRMTILRAGKEIDLTLERISNQRYDLGLHRYHTLTGDPYKMLPSGVAYMALDTVKKDSVKTWIEDAISNNAKGLIIDCRSYPSDFPIFALGGHLVSQYTPFVTFTIADKSNPGSFLWKDYIPISPREPHFSHPVVVLVDEVSISSAEYHALAFRAAPQAIVMGSTTAGADGNISKFAMPGGLSTVISGIGVHYADHEPTQRVGIVPDVVVKQII